MSSGTGTQDFAIFRARECSVPYLAANLQRFREESRPA